MKSYPSHEWVDSRIEIRPSPVAGRGMFARAPVRAGETVIVWGGWVCTTADVAAGRVAPGSTVFIGEDTFLGARVGEYDRERNDHGDFINHACDPTVWLADEHTLVARRDIAAGEELTIDYALFEGDEDDVKPWRCRCGSPRCRGRITGKDWRLPDLQERYRGRFSPFIRGRIDRLEAAPPWPAAPTIDCPGVELVETTADDRPVVENLARFCVYDFSELLSRDVGEDGTFGGAVPGLLRGCWEDPRRHTFLLRAAGKLAGFAIVEDHSEPPGAGNRLEMGEFFILRRYRRRGVGERAARMLFDRFPGRWVVYTFPQNAAAQVFWRTIIDRYTGGQFVAERLDGYGGLGYTWCFCSAGTGKEPQREC